MKLYIFWFLHQTTTKEKTKNLNNSCISFDSYIKPQLEINLTKIHCVVYLLIPTSNHNSAVIYSAAPWVVYLLIPTSNHNRGEHFAVNLPVVYLLIPTSNHNCSGSAVGSASVVYLLIPTSNHNPLLFYARKRFVVYLLIPTSNHNSCSCATAIIVLYIFWFLHQTTTFKKCDIERARCISFDSYIKPQPITIKCQRTNIL